MTPETTILVQVLGGIALFITAIGALITSLRTNRKVSKSAEEKKKEAAEAAQIIVDAAADQVEVIRKEAERATCKLQREREESDRWKNECEMLSGKIIDLTKRVSENEDCQGRLTRKLAEQQGKLDSLEYEKKSLMGRIIELEAKIEILQTENKRLKEERENEKAIIADE